MGESDNIPAAGGAAHHQGGNAANAPGVANAPGDFLVPLGEVRPFRYEALTADGVLLQGAMLAHAGAEVQARLGGMGLRVVAVEAAPVEGKPWRRAIGADDFLLFNQQLAHLAEAGLPVERGLRLIAADVNSGRLSRAAQSVADDLEKGVPLADAFSRHAGQFPPLYGKLVDAGVSAGNLPGMLFNLGQHLQLVSRLRQSIARTLAYPIMVLAVMSVVLLFISTQVLPMFRDIFASFSGSMEVFSEDKGVPMLTRILLAAGDVYPCVFWSGWALVALTLAGALALRLSGKEGMIADGLLIRLPLVGPILRASLLARWSDALRLGVEAGLDLPRAFGLAAEATGSPRLERESAALGQQVAGEGLQTKRGWILPPTMAVAIGLASKAGNLPDTLASLSRLYQRQAEHRLRLLPTLVTPIFLFIMGGTVMMAIAAMFYPLWRLLNLFSGGF